MSNSVTIPIKGSERTPLAGARAVGPTDPHQLIEVSVIIKHRQPLEVSRSGAGYMGHAEFAALVYAY